MVTGDSQEEVMIFRYRQRDRHTLHHNIYISSLQSWQVECDLFAEHIDYVEDVCRLIRFFAFASLEDVCLQANNVQSFALASFYNQKAMAVTLFIISEYLYLHIFT